MHFIAIIDFLARLHFSKLLKFCVLCDAILVIY